MALHGAERLPALFIALDSNLLGESEWVSKYPQCDIKTDRVLAQIDGRFGGIPFKRRRLTLMLLH